MKNALRFSATEIAAIAAIIAGMVDRAVETFEQAISPRLDGSLEDVIGRNNSGAQDGRKGNDGLIDLAMDCHNEGMVLENLGAILIGKKVDNAIVGIVIRKAMAEDERIDRWVHSIIAGTKACDVLKMASGKFKADDHQVQQGAALKQAILGS